MKYVALLSGGKDSCFNLLHCKKNGHQLVAVASLAPEAGKDEIDSYLYQTVGQDGISLIADALRVPLHRRIIHGHPLEQGAEYGAKSPGGIGTVGDETEDLYALLNTVLDHHPEIQAVSVGAILSNYQRVRVEHVCRRLSLTPLAYLWQRNQVALLSDMLSARLDAILIKVAGAGLTPSHLGLPLSKVYPTLLRLHKIYGTHPCGEGGEYESFTLDCPAMFNGRVVLNEIEKVESDQCDVAPVAYLRIRNAIVVNKSEEELSAEISQEDIAVPTLLETCFQDVRMEVARSIVDPSCIPIEGIPRQPEQLKPLPPSVRTIGPWIAVGNVRLPLANTTQPIEEQVTLCFNELKELLALHTPSSTSDTLASAAVITLLLPTLDPATFSAANVAYSAFFGASPPARACVGAGDCVTLHCVAWAPERASEYVSGIKGECSEKGVRKSLHVQSLSYWAPANIGPYSQAINIPPWTFVSGQIGLLPASLSLPASSRIPPPYPPAAKVESVDVSKCLGDSSLPLETSLVLQHTARVIRAAPGARGNSDAGGFNGSDGIEVSPIEEKRGGHVLLVLYYLVNIQDVKHVQNGIMAADGPLTPTLYTVVTSLPRGARLEKEVVVHSGLFVAVDPNFADSNGDEIERTPTFSQGDVHIVTQCDTTSQWQVTENVMPTDRDTRLELHWEVSHFLPSTEACAVLFVRGHSTGAGDAIKRLKAASALSPFLTRTLSAKVFVSPEIGEPEQCTFFQSFP
ncbi:hypothetical protein SCLCIDRAFT_13563 [Scleroderma citrinum Foug A]|uniref:Diphthine--ammonia ligase n=1 Tax=Scleroderma citrinum Foug A TaxID=1036808 RepID=A0A0C3EKS9_9AGAM|nr:hypothetical protein SCLCIDRAFT_13563 [Scleroderma citrinum Foug A]